MSVDQSTVSESAFIRDGRLSLDLTWALRYRAVAPTELLAQPADLVRWITAAIAPVTEPVSPELLADAVRLREAIHDAARRVVDGRRVRPADRATINGFAARPAPFPELGTGGAATVRLRPGSQVESALAAIALDAVDLLSRDDGRLRACEGPACSLLFHDASRPGRRRWCSAERCGNRVNIANYRRRRAGGRTEL